MTSLLRRKHRITRPNTRRRSDEERGATQRVPGENKVAIAFSRSSILVPRSWICSCLLLALVGALALADSANAELQWQKGKSPKSLAAAKRKPTYQRHHDGAVRPAAFEEEATVGPRLTSAADEGRASMRSIIVHSDDKPNDVRVAQLPTTSGTGPAAGLPSTDAQPTTPGNDESLEKNLGLPFGEMPEQTPPPEPRETTTAPLEGEDAKQLSPDDMLPEKGRQPQTFQPLPPPDQIEFNQNLRQEITPDVTRQDPEPGTSQESCDESWKNLKAKTIDTVNLSIAVTGTQGDDFPYECQIEDNGMMVGRCWPQITYLWKASALCHKPLYFEDEQLERYGHSWPPCVQPLISGAHFFCTLPVLPYCMGVEPPTECIYALGHYRPGNCAPYMIDPIPLSARGAVLEAGAWTGAALVIP